jgi:hypothetical protein
MQVVVSLADSILVFGFFGQFLQSVAEATAAAGPVFRLIDEVNFNK